MKPWGRLSPRRLAYVLTLVSQPLFADVVSWAPSKSSGGWQSALDATSAELARAGHKIVAAPDSSFDTKETCMTQGTALGVDWIVWGHSEWKAPRTAQIPGTPEKARIELFACQVSTGRIESVARTIWGDNIDDQIGEMTKLVIRPEGLGDREITWSVQPTVITKTPPVEPVIPFPVYGDANPWAVSAGMGAFAALARPSGARGNSTSATFEFAGGVAPAEVPRLEVRAQAGTGFVGQRAFHADLGARYMFAVLRGKKLFVGPEATFGVLYPFGGDESLRGLVRGAGVVSVGITSTIYVEATGEGLFGLGGTGTLALAGGTLRGAARF